MNTIFDIKTQIKLPVLLGMVHVRALPGTPFNFEDIDSICQIAVKEAEMYRIAGFDGILIENMHDRPYLKGHVGPEIIAGMTRVATAIRKKVGKTYPIGIQILAGANIEALAVAHIAKLDFIRAEGVIFAHVADEGMIEACAGELLRERKRLGAERVRIWTDIQKKHSAHSITSDLKIEDWVHGSEFFGLDGVIVTGSSTGKSANTTDLELAKKSSRIPVAIGSGITPENVHLYSSADALIVGSSMKYDGLWSNPIDPSRLKDMVKAKKKIEREA